jgi:hypothetical protein
MSNRKNSDNNQLWILGLGKMARRTIRCACDDIRKNYQTCENLIDNYNDNDFSLVRVPRTPPSQDYGEEDMLFSQPTLFKEEEDELKPIKYPLFQTTWGDGTIYPPELLKLPYDSSYLSLSKDVMGIIASFLANDDFFLINHSFQNDHGRIDSVQMYRFVSELPEALDDDKIVVIRADIMPYRKALHGYEGDVYITYWSGQIKILKIQYQFFFFGFENENKRRRVCDKQFRRLIYKGKRKKRFLPKHIVESIFDDLLEVDGRILEEPCEFLELD